MFCHSFCSLFLISYFLSWIKTSCQRHLLPYRETNLAKEKKKRKEGRKPTKVFSIQRLVKNWSVQFSDNSAGRKSDIGSGHFLSQAFKMTSTDHHLECILMWDPEAEGPAKPYSYSWLTETVRKKLMFSALRHYILW